MKGLQVLEKIAENHGGIIETKIAEKEGVSRASLSSYNRQGKICRVSLGRYKLMHEEQDILHFLGDCSKQYAYSHDTALFLHGLTEELPLKPSITIVSGRTPSSEVRPLSNIFFIKKELFDLGKTVVTTESGNSVFVYDLERTMIDMIRSRRRLGEEAVFQSLRAYYRKTDKDIKKIFHYAEAFKMGVKFSRYWDAILREMEEV